MFAKLVVVVCLVVRAFGLPNYPTTSSPTSTTSSGEYGTQSEYGTKSEYGTTTRCTPYEETVYVDRCEHYNEQVCYTTHQEQCEDVHDQNCRAIVSGAQTRKCFNVTELICGLKEEVQYEVVNAVFTVQKCHKVSGKSKRIKYTCHNEQALRPLSSLL
jgi:hypothetical protein